MMLTLYKQEVYKQIHKIGWWIALAFMVLVQITFGIVGKRNPSMFAPGDLVSNSYIGGGLVMLIAIASTASIIAMEFQYGTMKQLLYRQYYRSQVFISKILTALTQLVFLQVVAGLMTVGLTLILFPSYNWAQHVGNLTHGLIYLRAIGSNLLVGLLLLSVVILLSTVFKSNAAAIATGLVGYFLAQLASTLMIAMIAWQHWTKFLPFTFLLTNYQIQSADFAKLTLFSTPMMIGGTLLYTVVFTLIAYLSFRKRSV